MEGLAQSADLHVGAGQLPEQSLATRNRLDQLVAGEESHTQMLAELEKRHDELSPSDETLPTSDELAAQVEQFLREQEDEPDQ